MTCVFQIKYYIKKCKKFLKDKKYKMLNINNNVKNLLFLTIFLTSFLLWFLYSNYLDKYSSSGIYEKLNISKDVKNEFDLNLLWESYDRIKNEYYSIDWIKKEDLVSWMVSWMIDSLWDKHSEYMSPSDKKSFEETLAWDFEWIWAVVEKVDSWVVVSMVIKWSPAKESWILNWDLITKADWIDLKDKNLYDAVKLIKWPAWTKVILTIKRSWEIDSFEKEVTRQKITIPSVQTKILEEDNLGYIALNMYWDKTSEEFRNALKDVKNAKVEWLIIDLRDNWWGYLQSAVEILSEFVEKWKTLVKVKYRDSLFDQMYYSLNNWEIYDKKIVIIVNWNTASASEITAWALREYDKAIIVWEKTFGKWSVQEPFDLSNWWLLKLTIAKWFTPKWHNIDKDWINPDIEVLFKKEDYEKHYDRQLEEAKKVLKEFIKHWALKLSIDRYKEIEKEEI